MNGFDGDCRGSWDGGINGRKGKEGKDDGWHSAVISVVAVRIS